MATVRTFTRVLGGEEDLLLRGEGVAQQVTQTRKSGNLPVTALSLAVVVADIAELRTKQSTLYTMAMTRGATSLGDNVEGIFYWDINVSTTDDGVNVIQVAGVSTGRWIRTHRGSVNPSLTAFATGGQGSAVLLDREMNKLTTVATAGDSVKLPPAQAGMVVHIKNRGANAADIFPASGDFLDAALVNIAASLGVGAAITYRAIDGATWESV